MRKNPCGKFGEIIPHIAVYVMYTLHALKYNALILQETSSAKMHKVSC